jgi:hypothetical protein
VSLRLGVIGLDHLHVFELVQGLLDAGANAATHVADGEFLELYEGWRPDSVAVHPAELLADDRIDVVVTAGIPSQRADVAVAALSAGKHVLSAKPGVTTAPDLQRVRRAVATSGRRWSVLFTERFTNRATSEAIRLARSGAVGQVAHVIGSGPHTLNADERPAWFFDAATSGGILVDLASHQVDQFLAITGDLDAAVTAGSEGNLTHPEHPGFADIGTLCLVASADGGPVVGRLGTDADRGLGRRRGTADRPGPHVRRLRADAGRPIDRHPLGCAVPDTRRRLTLAPGRPPRIGRRPRRRCRHQRGGHRSGSGRSRRLGGPDRPGRLRLPVHQPGVEQPRVGWLQVPRELRAAAGVRACAESRNRLMKAYPDNVNEISFLADAGRQLALPAVVRRPRRNGLLGHRPVPHPKPPGCYSAEKIKDVEPVIDTTAPAAASSTGTATCVDNDARFVFGFVRSAIEAGAAVANYVELVERPRAMVTGRVGLARH